MSDLWYFKQWFDQKEKIKEALINAFLEGNGRFECERKDAEEYVEKIIKDLF